MPGKSTTPERRLDSFSRIGLVLGSLVNNLVFITFIAQPAAALNRELPIRQLIHKSWTARQGYAISAVQALAQSDDGYLWLGTNRGLLRFNGTAFSDLANSAGPAPPGEPITSLIRSKSGGLWMAVTGGIAHWREGRLTQYTSSKGVPEGTITAMAEDDAGSLWFATANGAAIALTVIRNGAVERVKLPPGLPRGYITALERDSGNRFWIGTSAGVCQWTPGAAASCWLTDPPSQIEDVKSSPSGASVLDSRSRTVRTFADGTWRVASPALRDLKGAVKTLLADNAQCIWIGTVGDGLLRSCNGSIEQFTRRDGLTSDLVLSLFQDREGNVWVGTSNGLDCFREPKVVQISTMEGLAGNACTAVCAARAGGVWVGTSSGGLDLVNGRTIKHYGALLGGATVLSLHEDATGMLWLGTTAGLYYRGATELVRAALPGGRALDRVVAMADYNGVLWAADTSQGLFRVARHRAEAETGVAIPRGRNIFSLYMDRAGELCIGYFQGGMTIFNPTERRASDVTADLPGGAVQAIYQDSAGSLWVAAEQGLSRRRNGRWTRWDSHFGPADGVEGITSGGDGNLWMLTRRGLSQVNAAAAGAIPDAAPSVLPSRLFGPADGIQFPESRRQVNPRLAQSQDGRVWASTDDGISVIDPASLNLDSVPPPVKIEQVLADGKPVGMQGTGLAFHSRQIEFEFAVLSLFAPESAEVRYRLEGFDDQWRQANGATRIAYGQLRPQTYRFHVIAANSDGVWNREGAVVEFRSLPEFYQTLTFQILCAGTLLGIAVFFYRLRIGLLRANLSVALAERNRIARELHDTLLQGFAGTLYLLKAACLQMDASPEAGMKGLHRALQQGDQSLKEARHSLGLLRLIALADQSLPEALKQAGSQIVDGAPVKFTMESTGKVRPLPHEVEAALFLIGREAVNNAFAHGQPGRIQLQLSYGSDRIQLIAEDDGIGFNLSESKSSKSHWGLTGIQERVKALGGHMIIDTQKGRGTRIEVTVPASSIRAFERRAKVVQSAALSGLR